MITCCRNCSERHIGCHSACQRYIKEAEANARMREAIRTENELSYSVHAIKAHLPRIRRLYAARG